jgi:hypothetical protein
MSRIGCSSRLPRNIYLIDQDVLSVADADDAVSGGQDCGA